MTGFESHDRLTVQAEVDTKDPMRARVLRTHADDELIGVKLGDLYAAG